MNRRNKIGLLVSLGLLTIYCIKQSGYEETIINLRGTFMEPDSTSTAKGHTGTGNTHLYDPDKETGSGISESHGENMSMSNRIDANLNRMKLNSSAVCNIDMLLNELRKMHERLYTKPTNETCKVRPAGCVVIGVAKSGTQELLNFLSIHPNVVQKHNLPNPNLFDTDSHLNKRKEQMPCTYSDQIGVVKTDYFFFREEMPSKFHTFNKNLKMILIVREPVERLISAYSFTYLQKKQRKLVFNYKLNDIPEIDEVFVDRKTGRVKTDQFDLSHSVYDIPLERYLKLFSKEQILVLDSMEFRNEPVKVLQRVERFLGLRSVITDEFFEYNQNKHFYCLKRPRGMVCYGSDRGRAKLKDIKPETRQRLHEYFMPHNEKFFNLIGQKFNWSNV